MGRIVQVDYMECYRKPITWNFMVFVFRSNMLPSFPSNPVFLYIVYIYDISYLYRLKWTFPLCHSYLIGGMEKTSSPDFFEADFWDLVYETRFPPFSHLGQHFSID